METLAHATYGSAIHLCTHRPLTTDTGSKSVRDGVLLRQIVELDEKRPFLIDAYIYTKHKLGPMYLT